MASSGLIDTRRNTFYSDSDTWGNIGTDWANTESWSIDPAAVVYETAVFDFGTKKSVIPLVDIFVSQGAGYVEVLYGDTLHGNGEIQTPTTLGSDLYFDLDYTVSGYTADTYTGFTARYAQVRVTAQKRNSDNTANLTAELSEVSARFQQEFEHEYFFDVNTTDLAGTTTARTIPVSKLTTPVAGIFYSTRYDGTTSNANGKYQIHTISKSTPSFAVFDLDKFQDNTGVDLDGIDIDVVGFPTLAVGENGSVRKA